MIVLFAYGFVLRILSIFKPQHQAMVKQEANRYVASGTSTASDQPDGCFWFSSDAFTPTMDIYKELYCGWLILVVLIDSYWVIECHMPEGEIYTDTKTYGTSEQALQEARWLIQRYTAMAALQQALPEWGHLNTFEEEK